MKKAITYEAPDVTVFEIHPEGALCGSVIYNEYGLRDIQDGDVTDDSDDWN